MAQECNRGIIGMCVGAKVVLPMPFSNADCNHKCNRHQQEEQETGLPVAAKRICPLRERLVIEPDILSFPEVSLKRHDPGTAFGQYLQYLRVRGAETGIERVLQNQTNGDAHDQNNA
jgi:hypothetical protein